MVPNNPVDLLARFAAFASKLPVSLPDRASMALGALTAADVRQAARSWRADMTDAEALTALKPFAEAGSGIPEKAREWQFGTSGLRYGDFMEAAALVLIRQSEEFKLAHYPAVI
jgi:hypothetical protein